MTFDKLVVYAGTMVFLMVEREGEGETVRVGGGGGGIQREGQV